MNKKRERWLECYEALALAGEPEAQIALAWEYEKGGYVEKDLAKSEELFKQAELNAPELARFNLAKARLMRGEPLLYQIENDGANGFGPSYYLIATYYKKNNDLQAALKYYQLGASKGHMVSEYLVLLLTQKSVFLRLKDAARMFKLIKRIFKIRFRDVNDPRILT